MAEYICEITKEDMHFQQYGELKQKLVRCKDCRYNCWKQGHETPSFWTPCREIKPEGNWFCWCGAAKDGDPE